jgi:hypothetical protein
LALSYFAPLALSYSAPLALSFDFLCKAVPISN